MPHVPCCHAPLSSGWLTPALFFGRLRSRGYLKMPQCQGSDCSSQLLTLQGASVRDVQAVSLLLCAYGQRPAHGLCRCVFCPYCLPWRQAAARLHSLDAGSCLQEPCLQAEVDMCTVACKVCKSREALVSSSYTFTVQGRQLRP